MREVWKRITLICDFDYWVVLFSEKELQRRNMIEEEGERQVTIPFEHVALKYLWGIQATGYRFWKSEGRCGIENHIDGSSTSGLSG